MQLVNNDKVTIMPKTDHNSSLLTLLNKARSIEQKMTIAIEHNKDDQVDRLSAEFEQYTLTILSYPTKSLTNLKHKCSFGQNLILPGHDEPEAVMKVFSQLIYDIEVLEKFYPAE